MQQLQTRSCVKCQEGLTPERSSDLHTHRHVCLHTQGKEGRVEGKEEGKKEIKEEKGLRGERRCKR